MSGAPRDPAFETFVRVAFATPIARALEVARPGHLARLSRGVERAGPCPVCGGRDRFAVNTRKNLWSCRGCARGGGPVELVRHATGLGFLDACEAVTGQPAPGRRARESEAERARRERDLAARAAQAEAEAEARDRQAERFRQRAIEAAATMWREAGPIAGSPVAAYLAARGLAPFDGLPLRAAAALPLHHAGETVHRGPAMLAPIVDGDRRFIGVHRTWIDPDRPGAKIEIVDRATGEVLAAKKMLGQHKGGWCPLLWFGRAHDAPSRLVVGEGIETTLSVATALGASGSARDLHDMAFAAALSLGAMAGPPKPGGPAQVPDLDRPAMPVPESVSELTLLADGDTATGARLEAVLARATVRFARPGRVIRVAWPGKGLDFNDVLRGTGSSSAKRDSPDSDRAHGGRRPVARGNEQGPGAHS